MARSAGLEPATSGLLGTCSIQLSYERIGLLALAFGVWAVCNHHPDAPNHFFRLVGSGDDYRF